MTNFAPTPLPAPAFAGGTKAITTTPIVGAPRREYAEEYVPGEEPLEDGELRVTVLGSGNPWLTRARHRAASWSRSATRSAICCCSTPGAAPSRTTGA